MWSFMRRVKIPFSIFRRRSRASIVTVQLPFSLSIDHAPMWRDDVRLNKVFETLGKNFELHRLNQLNRQSRLMNFSVLFQCSIDTFDDNIFYPLVSWRFLIRCLPFLTVLMYAIVADDCFEYWTEERRDEVNKKRHDQKQLKLTPFAYWFLFTPSTFTFNVQVIHVLLHVYMDKKETLPSPDVIFFQASFL